VKTRLEIAHEREEGARLERWLSPEDL